MVAMIVHLWPTCFSNKVTSPFWLPDEIYVPPTIYVLALFEVILVVFMKCRPEHSAWLALLLLALEAFVYLAVQGILTILYQTHILRTSISDGVSIL